jgi:hypothetical protein
MREVKRQENKNAIAFKNPEVKAVTSLLLFDWIVSDCKRHRVESRTSKFIKMQGY